MTSPQRSYNMSRIRSRNTTPEKIVANIARDELNALRLDTLSWTVITVWECELSKSLIGGLQTKKYRQSFCFL